VSLIDQIPVLVHSAVDLFLHLDVHLAHLVQLFGPWLYGIVFLVIFCETGLVVTPILPGDSLLFALGALAALSDSPLDIRLLAGTLIVAALLGDNTNYFIGSRIGPRVFKRESSRLLSRKHLDRTRAFYERHGGKTVIIARFVPIVRTFAPFVAGIGRMPYRRFLAFSITGAVLWVLPFLFGGYMLGNLPMVKRNFHIAVIAVVFVSVLPAGIEYVKAKRRGARVAAASPGRKEAGTGTRH